MKIFKSLFNRQNKKPYKSRFITLFLFFTLVLFLMAEIVLFIVYNVLHIEESNAYVVVLFVVPGCAVLITGALIYLNYRSYEQSNKLINGLNQVADGNFSYRIKSEDGEVFENVYSNFNKMAAELSTVQSLRESFVHDFSHEFKTPIACINGFANLLLEGNLTEEEQKQYLKIIADESQRLSLLSENTLLLSRLNSSDMLGAKEPYRLDAQIRDSVILLENEWTKKDITINSNLAEATFGGNAQLMQQVWLNLLYNAIKFTPQGGEIKLYLSVLEGSLKVDICDNGVGISQEKISRIFEKYYKCDASHSSKGNGLGLAIVKRVIDLHGGKIAVASKVGEGTTFTVTLPLK
ncbi:MAG: HAMP domain-containing histidine kinase [Clostridiales bacterium]|nr:HAMP domain-containing histidine kinase [Clostridiales bacterium]